MEFPRTIAFKMFDMIAFRRKMPAGEIAYITLSDEDIAALEELLDYLYFGSKRQ